MKLASRKKRLTRREFFATTAGAAGVVTIGLLGAAIPASSAGRRKKAPRKKAPRKKAPRKKAPRKKAPRKKAPS